MRRFVPVVLAGLRVVGSASAQDAFFKSSVPADEMREGFESAPTNGETPINRIELVRVRVERRQ